MAGRAVDVEVSQLLPSVNLVAQAQFTGGTELQAREQVFVGVSFDWTVWDWGGRYRRIDEARARVREVAARLEQVTELLGLEVEESWIGWEQARETHELAVGAAEIAEEGYRLTRARFEAGAVSALELGQAESALTRARLEVKAAEYGARLARARLARAVGADSEAIAEEASR
jgi:outer membrane protein TolC